MPPANETALFSTPMRCNRCKNGRNTSIAVALDAKTRPADRTELRARQTGCERGKNGKTVAKRRSRLRTDKTTPVR
jgi:hypothetical protein